MGLYCCKNVVENNVENNKDFDLKDITYADTKEPVYDFKKAKVIKVYDGDTFWVATSYNNDIVRFSVRLYGVDTPEIKDKNKENKEKAKQAKEYVESLILNKIVDIEILNNKKYNGKMVKEKYGRLLAIIKINGVDLAENLIEKGYGKPYYGGTK